jgi:hypothetical protein
MSESEQAEPVVPVRPEIQESDNSPEQTSNLTAQGLLVNRKSRRRRLQSFRLRSFPAVTKRLHFSSEKESLRWQQVMIRQKQAWEFW